MSSRLVFIDHSAQPGGGQLGLLRYLKLHPEMCTGVIFITGGPVAEQVEALGIETHILCKGNFSMRSIIAAAPALSRILKRLQPTSVVANSLYAGMALAIAPSLKRTNWFYYSRVSMGSLRGVKRAIVLPLFQLAFSGYIANSRWTASCVPKSLARRGVEVAYPVSGIAAHPLPRDTSIRSAGTVNIVTLSRPDKWKGLDILLDALDHIELEDSVRLQLDIYGGSFFSDPTYLATLHSHAQRSRHEINFHGHIDDVETALREADIFVLPTRQPEPFGQVVPQALSAGCICIVPNEGGPLEIVQDGINGYQFEARSSRSLAKVIAKALGSPDAMQAMSRAAQQRSRTFDDASTARMLSSAISRLAGGQDASSSLGTDC